MSLSVAEVLASVWLCGGAAVGTSMFDGEVGWNFCFATSPKEMGLAWCSAGKCGAYLFRYPDT